jgi:hypothetical protein
MTMMGASFTWVVCKSMAGFKVRAWFCLVISCKLLMPLKIGFLNCLPFLAIWIYLNCAVFRRRCCDSHNNYLGRVHANG